MELSSALEPGSKPLRRNTPNADLETLIERIERDSSRHMTAGPASESELAQLEASIGQQLPAPFRAFLARLGGGLYYERHEIFGPLRAMIHDIELVPPLMSVCRGLPSGIIPVHRADEVVHFMDLRPKFTAVPVFSLLSGERHPDFTTFLREIVVPPIDAAGDVS